MRRRASRRSRLELRLAGAARADAAAEPLEVLPHPAHARQVVLELRELDLELALGADGVLREDVEDQLRPVDDARLERVLEVALLRRLELVVDDQRLRAEPRERLLQLLDLALADVGAHRRAARGAGRPSRRARRPRRARAPPSRRAPRRRRCRERRPPTAAHVPAPWAAGRSSRAMIMPAPVRMLKRWWTRSPPERSSS